jgi:hypothetical protein
MNAPDIAAAAVTLFFIMDPLGNIPLFNAVLSRFDPARRARIVAREMLFALVILLMFLFAGNAILSFLKLSQSSLRISGGVLLFIIALRMIFPTRGLDEPEAAERLLPLAHDKNAAVIVNRPFGKGSMFRRTRGKPIPDWARELGIASWAQYFLKWIIAHPAVTCAIPGTGNPRHMVDNLGAAHGALPDAAMRDRMAKAFDAL